MSTESTTNPITRRSFILTTAAGCAVMATELAGLNAWSKTEPLSTSVFPPLPYKVDALEPYISQNTVRIHYEKHHRGYFEKTAELIKGSKLAQLPLEEIVKQTADSPEQAAIFNNAAQVWNHDFYWKSLHPGGSGPKGELLKQLNANFGSLENLKKEMIQTAMSQFGSGWAWLVSEGGKLKVVKTSNAGTPLTQACTPLLTVDVWEHAYYLDYQNRRGDYVKAVVDHLINWEFAESNLPKI